MKAVKSCAFAAFLAGVAVLANDASPVRKVITMLEDLHAKIEEDEGLDTKAYEKYMCWCDNVEKAKTASIEEGGKTIEDLAAEIGTLENLQEATEEKLDQNARDTADTEAAKKDEQEAYDLAENSYFRQEAGMREALASMEKARGLLGATDLMGLLQTDNSPVLLALKDVVKSMPMATRLPQKSLELLSQATSSTSLQEPSMAESVIGILNELKESYTTEDQTMLEDHTKEKDTHLKAQANFKEQLDLLAHDKAKLSAELAKCKKDLSDAKTLKAATERQKKEDEDFLAEAMSSKEKRQADFTARQSERQKELDGVNKALETLTDEKARELTSRSIKTVAFLQLSSTSSDAERAVSALQEQAAKTNSFRLAALAKQVKKALPEGAKDKGAEIISSMDTMITELKTEQASDDDKKAHCTQEYQEINKEVNKLTFLVQKKEAAIKSLNDKIDHKTELTDAASFKIGENEKELEKLAEIRQGEEDVYKKEKADDEAAIELLTLTRSQLAKFYEGSFVQLKQDPKEMLKGEDLSQENKDLARQEEGYTLSDKNSNKGAADMILAMIDHIVGNLKDEIADATKEEEDATADYEAQKAALEKDNEDLDAQKVDLASEMTKHRTDIDDEEGDKDDNNGGIAAKQEYKSSIQGECDFIISKHQERYDKRQAEISGINQAKDFLYHSGVFGTPSFFQTARQFLAVRHH